MLKAISKEKAAAYNTCLAGEYPRKETASWKIEEKMRKYLQFYEASAKLCMPKYRRRSSRKTPL